MEQQIKIGANCVLIKDNKVLMGFRIGKIGPNTWGFPGGHVEYGESLVDAAKRELEEETGIKATKLQFFHMYNDPRPHAHYIQINFLVTEWNGEARAMEPTKCEKWEWFDIDHLPENMFVHHDQIIPAYKNKVNFTDHGI